MNIARLCECTGFSKDAIRRRVTMAGLNPRDFDPRRVLQLSPIDGINAEKMSLEEARTKETIMKTEKLSIEIATLERQRIPVEQVSAAITDMSTAVRSTIDASGLPEIDKQDLYDELADIPNRLKWNE